MRLSKQKTIDCGVPPKSLDDFQNQFGQYLRGNAEHTNPNGGFKPSLQSSPSSNPLYESTHNASQNVEDLHSQDRVTRLYQGLVFNNICGFVDRCFRVCKSLVTKEKWQQVCEQFVATHPCHSPYFMQINQSFVDYLALPDTLSSLNLPPYFAELAHYEWMELYVSIHGDDDRGDIIDRKVEDGIEGIVADVSAIENKLPSANISYCLQVNATTQNLHYQWSVHTINTDNIPDAPQDSFFLIYRHPQTHEVKFMQINALTHALVDYIKKFGNKFKMPHDSEGLMLGFADTLGVADGASLMEFGVPLLDQLLSQHVLYKTFANPI